MHPSSSSSSSSASASASTSSPAPAHPPPSNTDSGFEFYDPRGLFSRRRSSSGATSTSQANRNAAKQALQRQWEQQQRRGGKVEEEEDREGVGQGEGKQHGGSIVEEEDSDRRDSSMMSWLSLSSSSIPERSEDENPTSASPACSSCHSDHVNKVRRAFRVREKVRRVPGKDDDGIWEQRDGHLRPARQLPAIAPVILWPCRPHHQLTCVSPIVALPRSPTPPCVLPTRPNRCPSPQAARFNRAHPLLARRVPPPLPLHPSPSPSQPIRAPISARADSN